MQFITTGNRIMTENFTVGLFYTITFLNGNILACSCNGIGDNFVSFLCTEPTMQFILELSTAETVDTIELYGGGAGTMNYNELENKPSINGETLVGNLTTTDLHIRAVPPIDTTDNNKVLTASYAGGVTSYSWQTIPTETTNYNDLTNKPEINGHVLSGNQLSSQLGLASAAQGALADTAVQPATLASYQPLIDNSHKLSSDLVDDSGHTNKFATQTQLDQIETNKNNISKALTLEKGIAITSGADLNTYTTIGVYYAEDINIARSLTNSPVNTSTGSPFRLEVMENNTSSRIIQKIYEPAMDNTTFNVYIRAYTLSGWSSWYKVGLTAV